MGRVDAKPPIEIFLKGKPLPLMLDAFGPGADAGQRLRFVQPMEQEERATERAEIEHEKAVQPPGMALPSRNQRSIPMGEHQFLVSAHLFGQTLYDIHPLLAQVQACELVRGIMLASFLELDRLVREFQPIHHSLLQFGEPLLLARIIVDAIADCSDIERDSVLDHGKGEAMRSATGEEVTALAVLELMHVQHEPMNAILSLKCVAHPPEGSVHPAQILEGEHARDRDEQTGRGQSKANQEPAGR